jgi:hypothetical protein
VLGADVDRHEHILSGCSACEYRIRFTTPEEKTASSVSGLAAKQSPAAPGEIA